MDEQQKRDEKLGRFIRIFKTRLPTLSDEDLFALFNKLCVQTEATIREVIRRSKP